MSNFNNAKNVAIVVSLGNEKDPMQSKLLSCETRNGTLEGIGSKLALLGKYALIVHDKDTKGDGTPKTAHIHIVLNSDKGASSNTWIKSVSEAFGGIVKEAISMEPIRSNTAALRYLIHADNLEKTQYDKTAIVTNMGTAVESALNQHEITLEGLLNCASASEYFAYVGKDNYSKYRSAWKDLQEEAMHNRVREDDFAQYKDDVSHVTSEIRDFISERKDFLQKDVLEHLIRWQQMLIFGASYFFEKENN